MVVFVEAHSGVDGDHTLADPVHPERNHVHGHKRHDDQPVEHVPPSGVVVRCRPPDPSVAPTENSKNKPHRGIARDGQEVYCCRNVGVVAQRDAHVSQRVGTFLPLVGLVVRREDDDVQHDIACNSEEVACGRVQGGAPAAARAMVAAASEAEGVAPAQLKHDE